MNYDLPIDRHRSVFLDIVNLHRPFHLISQKTAQCHAHADAEAPSLKFPRWPEATLSTSYNLLSRHSYEINALKASSSQPRFFLLRTNGWKSLSMLMGSFPIKLSTLRSASWISLRQIVNAITIQNLHTKPSYKTFIATSNCNCSPTRVLQRGITTTINNSNSSHHNHHHHNANNITSPRSAAQKLPLPMSPKAFQFMRTKRNNHLTKIPTNKMEHSFNNQPTASSDNNETIDTPER